jgi:hypothetical protein
LSTFFKIFFGKAAKMQKSNIKMENDKSKFKNELKIETTNNTNDTNIKKRVFVFYVNKKDCSNLFVKFVQFVVKKWVVLG